MLVLFDRQQVIEILRSVTPQHLLRDLEAGHVGTSLSQQQRQEFHQLLQDWVRRALGMVTLRDALKVDPTRGRRVYDLLCQAFTVGQYPLSPTLAQQMGLPAGVVFEPQELRTRPSLPTHLPQRDPGSAQTETPAPLSELDLPAVLAQADAANLALAYVPADQEASYPWPEHLDSLLPPPLTPDQAPHPPAPRDPLHPSSPPPLAGEERGVRSL
ncbi:MAG: hypothetical protein HC837_18320 [Chloroflexaceae bacterium]|nr:hypothetical protein [Chloroflexaceae bacterium]